MKSPNRGKPRGPARLAHTVNRSRPRDVPDVKTTSTKPAAEIRILPVQEVALIEPAHLVQSVPAREHAGAGHPVDVDAVSRLGKIDDVSTRYG